MATITLRSGKNLVDVFKIEKDEIFIGRERDNDIIIPDKSVSRKHLKITKRFDGFYLEDLGSANGTFFKNEKIKEKILESGDIIYIGTTGINIFFEDELSKKEDYQPTIADVTRFIELKEEEARRKGEPFELDLSKFEEKRLTEKPKKVPEKKEKKKNIVRPIIYLMIILLGVIVILSVLPKKEVRNEGVSEKKPVQNINVPIKDLSDYNMLQKKISSLSSEGEQLLSVCESTISKLTTENTKENRELLAFLAENISSARNKITEVINLSYQSKKGFSEDIFNAIEAGKAKEETISYLREKNEELSRKLEELQRKIDEIKNSFQAKIGEETSNLIAKAREAFQKGKYQECIDLTNKVLEMDPNNTSAKDLQDSALKRTEEAKRSQIERAQREIQIKKRYDEISTHYRLGLSYIERERLFMGLKEWDSAQESWNYLKSIAPSSNPYYQEAEKLVRDINSRYMGIAQKRRERISEAIKLYREGERYREIDSKKALQYYRQVLEVLKDPYEEYFQKAKKRIQTIEENQ